jgi:Txe/YoeB family toxin of Txe-Axe toxin-antitoxin module
VSEEELNDQINDQLNQLWTGLNDRRKKLVRNLTPNYSRRTDQSSLNQSSTHYITENQLLQVRDKLALEVSASKQKDAEIDNLKKTISQLTNDKKMLVYELQQIYGNNENANSSLMNESSIMRQSKRDPNKNTANFESMKKKHRGSNFATIEE